MLDDLMAADDKDVTLWPILYGCGDFITDYEGIEGYEQFRGDLAIAYLPRFEKDGTLSGFTLKPY